MSSVRSDDRRLAAYLEGAVSVREARRIEQALATSPALRQRYESMRRLASSLAAPVTGQRRDLVAAIRSQIAVDAPNVGPVTPARRAARGAWTLRAAVGIATVTALAGVFVVRGQLTAVPDDEGAEFRAKGGAAAAARWTGVRLYLQEGQHPPRRVEPSAGRAVVGADAGFLFSYINGGPSPRRYLMVFGVDARGGVRWFYPAFNRAGSDPISVAIVGSARERELPELIRHRLPRGPLQVYAVFSSRSLSVSQIEAAVLAGALPLPGTDQHRFELEVQ